MASDWGDAPTPYPTLSAEDGAEHTTGGALRLGATVDSESNGTHSANANADGADEDGVTFGEMRVGQLDATVTVNVQGAAGKLDAWIDFNQDGNWGGPGEQIFASQNVVVGNNNLMFDVSSYAIAGTTYARFRLSTAGDLGVKGTATDGEVEDYQVVIGNPAASSGIFGPTNTIFKTFGPISVHAADMDGDGDMDVVNTGNRFGSERFEWHENDGNQNFTPHVIASSVGNPRDVFPADVDGDGDMDVLGVSPTSNRRLGWYENDGSQNFTPRTITTHTIGVHDVFPADVDDDGDLDVLITSIHDDKISWYENDGSENFTRRTISTTSGNPLDVFPADVDGDGDIDVVSASHDDIIAWYENNGSQNFTAHTITTARDNPNEVFAADLDGDGDMDVLSSSSGDDTIAWYENDGSQNFTSHTISTTADHAFDVFAADMNGDGHVDVLSSSQLDNTIAWYQNDGSENFTRHIVTTDSDRLVKFHVADIDGDADLDVVGALFHGDEITWYENLDSDYGDAPSPYPTSDAENGARHTGVGPTLGQNRDLDPDGMHSDDADFDDITGTPDDEDGVTFGTLRVGEPVGIATVTVAGASGGAKLDAWIDFNGDGTWDGPGEQIATNLAVVNGNNSVTFNLPGTVVAGDTFARFRLSSDGNLAPTGSAADGEVEDHKVTILPLDNTAPVFESLTRKTPAGEFTNADTLTFLATFSEDVQDVDAADFNRTGTTATLSVTPLTGSTYEITLSGGNLTGLDGNVQINLRNSHNITDLANNDLPDGEPATDERYTVDNTSPSLLSLARKNPTGELTNNDTLTFLATFSEDVQNVTAGDFNRTGTTATLSVTQVTGSTYDIILTGGDLAGLNGNVQINLTNTHNITDLANNDLPDGEPATDESYTLDNTAPSLLSFDRKTPTDEFTNADTLTFLATFSEDVQNVNAADFNRTGTSATLSVTQLTGSTYDIMLAGGDLVNLDANVQINLRSNHNITDRANNDLPDGDPGTDESYTVDNTAPTAAITRADADPTNADSVLFDVIFSEDVSGVNAADFEISKTGTADGSATLVVGNAGDSDPSTYRVRINNVVGDGTLGLDFTAGQNITDSAGNAANATPTADEVYTIDNTAPNITSIVRQAPGDETTDSDTPTFRVTFSENVMGVNAADFELAGAGSTSGAIGVTMFSANIYDVQITNVDDNNGLLDLNFAAGQNIKDIAGNDLDAGTIGSEETYTLLNDQTPPTLAITRAGGEFATASVTFNLDFSEDVANVNIGDFNALRVGVSFGSAVVGDAGDTDDSTYTLTFGGLTGEGTLALEIVSNTDITDQVGNALDQTPTASETFTVSDTPFLVSNTDDDGFGSLRFAISFANDIAGADTILFTDGTNATHNFTDTTPDVITLGSQLSVSDDLTLIGPGPDLLTIDGDNNSRVFEIQTGNHDVQFERLNIINGSTAQGGGGLQNFSGGAVVVDTVVFSGNTAASGGAIANTGAGSGSLTVRNSTLSDNVANGGSGGGAIANQWLLNVLNSTISGNQTDGTFGGAGVLHLGNITSIVNSTIVQNSSTGGNGGGITRAFLGTVDVNNSIVSGNTSPGADNVDNIDGNFNGNDNLIDGDASTIIDTALQNNGGLTPTHALSAGSSAIDAGSNASANGASLTTDQRGTGFDRIVDGTVDIGAFETNVTDTTAPTWSAPRDGATPKFTSADTVAWLIQFDEDVTGVDDTDFEFNFTPTTVTLTDNGDTDDSTYLLTVSGLPEQKLKVDTLADGHGITDAAGNLAGTSRQGSGSASRYIIDRMTPTGVLSTVADPGTLGVIPVTATFSENVFGFELSDIVVTNGTASFFFGNEMVRTFHVTPDGPGDVTISIPAAAGTDLAGNELQAVTPLEVKQVHADITRVNSTPTTASSVDFNVVFTENVVNVVAEDFEVVTTGSASADSTVVVSDGGDGDDATWVVTVTGVTRYGTVGLNLAADHSIQTPQGIKVNPQPTTDEVYDIIDDPHGLLSLSNRMPGNVTVLVAGVQTIIVGDGGDNGISISSNTAGDIIVAGVGGTTINRRAEVVLHTGTGGIIPGNLNFLGLAGRDLLHLADAEVAGIAQILGGSELDAIHMIDSVINGRMIVREDGGDGFVDIGGSTIRGVGLIHSGDGNNHAEIVNSDFENVFAFRGGIGDDNVTLDTVTVALQTQFATGRGADSIQLNGTSHQNTLYISTDADNDSVSGSDVDVTSTFFVNSGSGDDVIDFDDLHAMHVSIVLTGTGNDAMRFRNSVFDQLVNMPTTSGNNVLDLDSNTFNAPLLARAGGAAALAARLKNNTFNDRAYISGGSGSNPADVLLLGTGDDSNNFAFPTNFAGFEDQTNNLIDEAFEDLMGMAFP